MKFHDIYSYSKYKEQNIKQNFVKSMPVVQNLTAKEVFDMQWAS